MNFMSILALIVSTFASAQEPTQPEISLKQESTTIQSTVQNTIDEYTAYLKQELADTYQGLGELGTDFIIGVSAATAPVSSVIAIGFTELKILAQDGARTLKQELLPAKNVIASAYKKIQEIRSNIKIENI